ncbi:hypothetical protein CERSUDRAFT_40924, partial [Gelatoporia subvermispora B]
LFLIERNLRTHNQSLANFQPMPLPVMEWEDAQHNHLIAEQRDFDQAELALQAAEQSEQMNTEQTAAMEEILDSVQHQQGRVFFLHGPAGTGKTFCYTAICAQLRSQGKIVLCVASSGIAALLLDTGRTVHSRFHVPINIHETSMCSIRKNDLLADLLRQTNLII